MLLCLLLSICFSYAFGKFLSVKGLSQRFKAVVNPNFLRKSTIILVLDTYE